MHKPKKLKGFSLVELIVAIGLFTMAISSFAFLGIEAYQTLKTSQNRITASQKSKEIADAIMLVKNESWANIVDNTNYGYKHILNTNGMLSIENGEKAEDGLTYFFTINLGYRDENGNLTEIEDEPYEDISSRIINLTIIFDNNIFTDNEYNTKIYINNWNTKRLTQETAEDFALGTSDGTEIIIDEGAIKLARVFLPDWCAPQHTHSKFDLPRQGEGTALTASPGHAYIVTGGNASGLTFLHAEVSSTSPPTIKLLGSLDGAKGKDIYVDGNYVYVSTDSKSQSVLIINTSTLPYVTTGYYGTNSPKKSETVYAYQNYGFVGYENKIDIFDISQKTGVRPKITTVSIGTTTARVKDIVVKENYAFVAMGSYTSQLVIIDISDINNPQIVGQIQLNDVQANTVLVSENTNTTYIGTSLSAGFSEFFVINTINKSAPSLISSFETNGMHIVDMVIIENRAILGGYGSNNYIVVRLDNINSPEKCGELLIPGDVLALDVVNHENKLFTYILTGDANNELQVIEGGPGGGDATGYGYLDYGQYLSKIFDMDTASIRLYSTHIYGEEPDGTTLKVQFRLGNEPNLSDATWFGLDGTANSYFTLGENTINLSILGRYFQYKVEMTSNNFTSPILDKIEIVYD